MECIGRLPALLLFCTLLMAVATPQAWAQADLELDPTGVNLTAGQSFTAGEDFALTWQVLNVGNAPTTAWVDAVYITANNDPTLSANAIPIVSTFDLFGLGVGGVQEGPDDYDTVNFVGCGTFQWPITLAPGEYYIAFEVDATNLVFEGSNEDNLSYVGPFTIDAAPQTVDLDLNVAAVTLTPNLASYAPGQAFGLSWNVVNAGAGICNSDFALNWIDRIYAAPSQTPGAIPPGSVEIFSGSKSGPLNGGGSYNGPNDLDGMFLCNTTACWPSVAGQYWLLFVLDGDNDIHEGTLGEANNFVYVGPFTIESDFNLAMVPNSITVNATTATGGETLDITYDVINSGSEAITLPWTEVVMLTTDGNPTLANVASESAVLGTFLEDDILAIGETRTRSFSICIPQEDSYGGGDYFVGVFVDGEVEGIVGNLFALPENTEADNWESGPALAISPSLQPDLQAAATVIPQMAYAQGETFEIDYTVTNAGLAPTDGNSGVELTDACGFPIFTESLWAERVVFAPTGTMVTLGECPGGFFEIPALINSALPLTPGDSATRSITSTIPAGLPAGLYDIWLCIDSDNDISEDCADCEVNNTLLLGVVSITSGNPIPEFRRGDCNGVDTINLIDGTRLLSYLFATGPEPSCLEACDFDSSNNLNLVDAVNLLQYLFAGGPPPGAPGPNLCGPPPAVVVVGCGAYDNCP